MKISRIAPIAAALMAIAGSLFVYTDRRATVRSYFWLEQKWIEHWPIKSERRSIEKLAPVLARAGILRPVRVQVEPGISFLLDPRDLVPVTILRTGEWQPEVWNSIAPSLSEGSVFFDVGAHIGYFSLKAAPRVGTTGQVVSFEPNPETLQLLCDNVTANHAQNVIVEPIACTDREQTLTFYAAPVANTGASSLARQNASISPDNAPRAYSVRGRRIDDVVRELHLTRIDAIKVDVEGAELFVVRGASDSLRRFHPKLVIEIDPGQLANLHTTADELTDAIKAAGYNRSRPLNPRETDWEWTVVGPGSWASTIRMADVSSSSQLIRGFHDLENKAWRWTAGKFTVALRTPPGANQKGAWLVLKFAIPAPSLDRLKTITLSAKFDGAGIASETFTTPGEHRYQGEVPASMLAKDVVEADFSLDKVLPPGDKDGRELGVIVTSVGLEPK